MILRRIVVYVLAALIAISLTEPLMAEVPLKSYYELKNDPQFKNYLLGVGRGIFWSNVILGVKGLPKLFCPPGKLGFDAEIVLSIIEQEVNKPTNKKGDYRPDSDIEMIAVQAFAGRFPCE